MQCSKRRHDDFVTGLNLESQHGEVQRHGSVANARSVLGTNEGAEAALKIIDELAPRQIQLLSTHSRTFCRTSGPSTGS